jgi:endonuclease/exonuclease/phosphatase family metal-dependent hydrolase
MVQETSRIAHLARTVEATAVFLFFYQALRVLFSVLFGVIYDAVHAEIVPMSTVGLMLGVVILALLAPLLAPRRPSARRTALLGAAVLVFLGRIPLTFNVPQARLVAAVVIVAGAGLYLAAWLRAAPGDVIRPLICALAIDQVLRAAGHTFDVTLRAVWWPGQVMVSLALCLLAVWLSRQRRTEVPGSGTGIFLAVSSEGPGRTMGLLSGLAWGSWLFLETSLLAFSNAVARWSSTPYHVVAPLLLGVTLLPLLEGGRWTGHWGRVGRVVSAIALLGGLTAGHLLIGPVALMSLLLAQLAVLSLLRTVYPPPTEGQRDGAGGGLAVGGLLFLVLSFAYAFAFTYAYTLDLFRGMGLPIVLVAAVLATLPALRRSAVSGPFCRLLDVSWAALLSLAMVLLVVTLAWPRVLPPAADADGLRIASYNIHYGYDTDWHLSLEAQAQTIEASGADVVTLQEVDTGRPTSYMVDNALWLARRLGMKAVYLPCVEHVTGIALLSRYPILRSEGMLLPSELEQTGIIWAVLDMGSAPMNAFAIWLGLEPEERARQLDAALPFLASHAGPAVFGGDFNSTPDSPVYARIAGAGFVDPFPALGLGSPPTDPAINPRKRIDFVWLRDLIPVDAQVSDSTASDHRLVVVKAALP